MLVRAEVSRRAEALNSYVSSLKEKVYQRKYKEAQVLILKSRDSINNSYMAPYDPNVYLLDSLKTKSQKLMQQKAILEDRLCRVNERMEKNKLKKGIKKGINETVIKASLSDVGVYASRITLTLKDAHKLDYEHVSIETDFFQLKIIFGSRSMQINFSEIITFQSSDAEILLSWRNSYTHIENYLILSFSQEQDKAKWEQTIKFCKLIDQSKRKTKLFMKPESGSPETADRLNPSFLQINAYHSKDLQQEINNNQGIQSIIKNVRKRKSSVINPKQLAKPNSSNNLNVAYNLLSKNKGSSYDRMRRQSEYYPFGKKSNVEENANDNRRKISADFTTQKFKFNLSGSGYFNEKKINRYKSQKSFDDNNSHSNSNPNKKEKEKEKEQEREREHTPSLGVGKQKQEKLGNKMKQIFVNDSSSIHWIEEEHEDDKSKDSYKQRNSQAIGDVLNVFEEQNVNDSKHISEQEVLEGEESPTIPYNMRKGKSIANFEDKFTVIPMEKEEDKEDDKEEQSGNERQQKDRVNQNEEGQDQMNEIDLMQKKDASYFDIENDDNEEDHQTSSDNEQKDTEKYDLEYLTKGIILLKCAQKGWQPHVKKLYLSMNHSDLCWMQAKGQNKCIPLSNVQSIRKGNRGKGIMRHVKDIVTERCLIIRAKVNSESKHLEFYLQPKYEIEILDDFVMKLKTYWEERFKQN